MKTNRQEWFMLELLNGAVQSGPPPIQELRVISADTQEPRIISEESQEERIT
jgi:hypothetical protein